MNEMRRQWVIWGHGILLPELQDGVEPCSIEKAREVALMRYGNVLPPEIESSFDGGYVEPGVDADGDLVWRNTAHGERLEVGRTGAN